MVLNKKLFLKARELRKNSKSYKQISGQLKIPKSTLSGWFSHYKFSQRIKNNLVEDNRLRSKLTIKSALKSRLRNVQVKHQSYIQEAKLAFARLHNDLLFISGLSIYWGEGTKAGKGIVSVANTDPDLMQIIANFYRNSLTIQNSKLRIGLFIYKDINETKAKRFWSEKLKIPNEQFIKTQILDSKSKLTKKRSKYGICSLYFSSTEFSIKIQEWIRLLGLEMRE